MLGFSLTKILFTALVVFGVWMLFKKFGITKSGDDRADRVRRAAESTVRGRAGADRQADQPPTVELIECPSCGNWIAPGTSCNCGYKHRG